MAETLIYRVVLEAYQHSNHNRLFDKENFFLWVCFWVRLNEFRKQFFAAMLSVVSRGDTHFY